MNFLARFSIALLLGSISLTPASAITLAEYAKANTITLFIPKKGAVMPNSIDSPGHLQLGTKALLLSGLGLSDLNGISQLAVREPARVRQMSSLWDEWNTEQIEPFWK